MSQTTQTPPEYYTVREVAQTMGVSKMTIYRLVDNGELPGGMRFGPKIVRIHRKTFDAWRIAQHSTAESASA